MKSNLNYIIFFITIYFLLLIPFFTPIDIKFPYPTNHEIESKLKDYHNSHTYINRYYDCSEMVQDFWNICITENWETKIGWKLIHEKEAHCFVYIRTNDDEWFAVDPTSGRMCYPNEKFRISEVIVNGSWYYENVTTFNDPLEFRSYLYEIDFL